MLDSYENSFSPHNPCDKKHGRENHERVKQRCDFRFSGGDVADFEQVKLAGGLFPAGYRQIHGPEGGVEDYGQYVDGDGIQAENDERFRPSRITCHVDRQ